MGLDIVELVMAVEEEFQVSIPNEQAVHLRTPRMLINAVEYLTDRPREEIAEIIRSLVIESTGIKEADYFEDADFVRDLRMD